MPGAGSAFVLLLFCKMQPMAVIIYERMNLMKRIKTRVSPCFDIFREQEDNSDIRRIIPESVIWELSGSIKQKCQSAGSNSYPRGLACSFIRCHSAKIHILAAIKLPSKNVFFDAIWCCVMWLKKSIEKALKPLKNQRFQGLVGDGGFEPPKAKPADLQSVPFGHSGNPPYEIRGDDGAGRRTRTPDLLITNQLLYQLSYTSISHRA